MTDDARILELVRSTWGHEGLRGLQEDAIRSGLARRDSLVVMPTGGGKSLCYQVPPLITGETSIVVSPLIALMKDQVDGLQACGYPAAAINSGLTPDDRRVILAEMLAGAYRLVFVAPERLLMPSFLELLTRVPGGIRSIAIDEAHCISQWGHDFRPEYRRLRELHQHFPGASLHAFTATATRRVQEDIVDQLGLREPTVLIDTFDRPNLVYRVLARSSRTQQILQVLQRHAGEAAIVYCLSRKETEEVADRLRGQGIDARAYHAGLATAERQRVQDEFSQERLDVVVATVAFGMGNRSQ